jgi:predicted membrane protein
VTANERPGFLLTPQVVLGLIIIVVGLVLTADNFGWLRAEDALRYWPLGLSALGLAKVVQARTMSGRVFGALLVLIGASITADQVYGVRVHLSYWWPLLLVLGGLALISRARDAGAAEGVPATSDQRLSEFAFWSGVRRRVASAAFRHADLTAIMGGIELDMRPAGTGGSEAVLDVFVLWGGIEITVPPDWSVSNRVVAIMGGADDKSSGTQAATNRLVIRGFVIMGGVDIKT